MKLSNQVLIYLFVFPIITVRALYNFYMLMYKKWFNLLQGRTFQKLPQKSPLSCCSILLNISERESEILTFFQINKGFV